MLELSDDAVREINELTGGEGGLRFVAHEEDGGAFSFEPSLVDEPEDGDVVVERDGARVYLDATSAEQLAEVTLEIESHGDHVHFDFVRRGEAQGDGDGSDAA